MDDTDLLCFEKIVLLMAHDVKEMRKSYAAALKGSKLDCKTHFIRHRESLEAGAIQIQEYNCEELPVMFQTEILPDTPAFDSCSRYCS